MMIQMVTVEEAIGLQQAHDITEVRSGEFKGSASHRGYVVKQDDVEHWRRPMVRVEGVISVPER